MHTCDGCGVVDATVKRRLVNARQIDVHGTQGKEGRVAPPHLHVAMLVQGDLVARLQERQAYDRVRLWETHTTFGLKWKTNSRGFVKNDHTHALGFLKIRQIEIQAMRAVYSARVGAWTLYALAQNPTSEDNEKAAAVD